MPTAASLSASCSEAPPALTAGTPKRSSPSSPPPGGRNERRTSARPARTAVPVPVLGPRAAAVLPHRCLRLRARGLGHALVGPAPQAKAGGSPMNGPTHQLIGVTVIGGAALLAGAPTETAGILATGSYLASKLPDL